MSTSVRNSRSRRKVSVGSRNKKTRKAEEEITRAALALPLHDRIQLLEAIVKQLEEEDGITPWIRKTKAKLELIRAMHPMRTSRKER